MENLRILIVDAFEPWARLVQTVVSTEPLYEVIGIFSDGYAALTDAEQSKPDLVLLDINLPTINGIDLCRSLQRVKPRPFTIFVSQNETRAIVRAAFDAGANGYVLKTEVKQELIRAITIVSTGERFLSMGLRKLMLDL